MSVLESRVPQQADLLEVDCSIIPTRDFPMDYLRPERQWLICSATLQPPRVRVSSVASWEHTPGQVFPPGALNRIISPVGSLHSILGRELHI
jgi:hypothetical protein